MPDNIRFDIDRDVRIGLPEAVFCEGKSHDALLSLLKRFASDDEKPILFTRLSESVWARVPEDLRAAYDYDPLSRTAWHAPARAMKRALRASSPRERPTRS